MFGIPEGIEKGINPWEKKTSWKINNISIEISLQFQQWLKWGN